MMESRTDRADRIRKAEKENQMLETLDAVRRTYKIVRSFEDEDKGKRIVKRGLTLEEARAHCHRPDTKGAGWFDGYSEEN